MKKTDGKENRDKRSEFRLIDEITVFIETYSSPTSDHRPVNLVISKTVDISANGIQVVLDHALPINSILRICLETTDNQQQFLLTAEVLWQMPAQETKSHSVGFQLLESDQTDILKWKQYIARRLSER